MLGSRAPELYHNANTGVDVALSAGRSGSPACNGSHVTPPAPSWYSIPANTAELILIGEGEDDGFGEVLVLAGDIVRPAGATKPVPELLVGARNAQAPQSRVDQPGKLYVYSTEFPVCGVSVARNDLGTLTVGDCATTVARVTNNGGSSSRLVGQLAVECVGFRADGGHARALSAAGGRNPKG